MRYTTMIPNEVMDVYLRELKPGELKVLLVVLRQTLGYALYPGSKRRKQRDWISIGKMQEMTGLDRKTIGKAINGLLRLHLIKVVDGQGNSLSTPKDRQGKKRLYFEQKLRRPQP